MTNRSSFELENNYSIGTWLLATRWVPLVQKWNLY